MFTTANILITFFGICYLIFIYLFIKRIIKMFQVQKFMKRNLMLAYEWNQKNINLIIYGKEPDAFDWFYSKHPSADELLFSDKPLTLDAHFDKKLLEKLFNGL